MSADVSSTATVIPFAALLGTLAWGLAGSASLFVGMMSVMLFDAPGAENDPKIWAFVLSIWSFPVLCVLSIVGSWVTWFLTRRWNAERAPRGRLLQLLVAGVPLLSVAAFAVTFAILFAAES
jgi:hypothetical protein